MGKKIIRGLEVLGGARDGEEAYISGNSDLVINSDSLEPEINEKDKGVRVKLKYNNSGDGNLI